MSKFLATAALVVGGIALAATGVGAVALGGLAGTITVAGVSTSTLALAAGGLSLASGLLAKKPSGGGASPIAFKADPNAGLPYAIGRTLTGGNIIKRKEHGANNIYQTIVTILSAAGPVQSIDALYLDKVQRPVGADGKVTIKGDGIYEFRQMGASPATTALPFKWAGIPDWSGASRLSGYAASLTQLEYDTKGKNTLTSTPEYGWVGHWVKVYDPRRDSTYPGGSGAHRWDDETTWEWSENPYLHALTWCIGRHANSKRILGLGARLDQIIVADFVEGANVADANRWTIGGVVYSRPDTKWNVLKQMLQAGGGEPMRVGARIGCLVPTPRVSLATVKAGDIVGDCSLPATLSRKERINGVVPRYRSEAHGWEMVPASVVRVQDYVAVDGDERTREIEYSLVQNVDQATQLGAYEIMHSREFGPGTFPLKPAWLNYRPGDCVTFDIPELAGQKVLILTRSLDPSTCIVTFTVRSETDAKHAFALSRIGKAPATPSISATPINPIALAVSRAAYLIVRQSVAYPLDSTADTITIQAFKATIDDGRLLTFRAQELTGLKAGTTYLVLWDLAASTFVAVEAPALTETASSAYVIVRQMTTINADGTTPSTPTPPAGDGGGGYGGGGCPVLDARILLANADRTGSGETIAAGEIEAGHWVWTKREDQLSGDVFGAYQVTMARHFESDLIAVPDRPVTSPSHLWWDGQGWVRSDHLGKPAGRGKVVALSVAQAATYQLVGDDGALHLSHNKRAEQEAA